jgi:hypothetical protein
VRVLLGYNLTSNSARIRLTIWARRLKTKDRLMKMQKVGELPSFCTQNPKMSLILPFYYYHYYYNIVLAVYLPPSLAAAQ